MYIAAAALLALRLGSAGDIAHLQNTQGLDVRFWPQYAKVWCQKPIRDIHTVVASLAEAGWLHCCKAECCQRIAAVL